MNRFILVVIIIGFLGISRSTEAMTFANCTGFAPNGSQWYGFYWAHYPWITNRSVRWYVETWGNAVRPGTVRPAYNTMQYYCNFGGGGWCVNYSCQYQNRY